MTTAERILILGNGPKPDPKPEPSDDCDCKSSQVPITLISATKQLTTQQDVCDCKSGQTPLMFSKVHPETLGQQGLQPIVPFIIRILILYAS